MANKTALNKDMKDTKTIVDPINKKNIAPNKGADAKLKKAPKKSFGIVPDAVGRSAVSQVKANSSRDVRGSSGLANTGTIISYD